MDNADVDQLRKEIADAEARLKQYEQAGDKEAFIAAKEQLAAMFTELDRLEQAETATSEADEIDFSQMVAQKSGSYGAEKLTPPPFSQTVAQKSDIYTEEEPTPPPRPSDRSRLSGLSDSARQALRSAAGAANLVGRSDIDSQLLLVGLYQKDDGPTRAVLAAFGWPPDNFYRWISQNHKWRLSADGIRSAADSLSPADLDSYYGTTTIDRTLEIASKITAGRNAPTIRSRHLLQALIQLGTEQPPPGSSSGSVPATSDSWLRELGVPVETVRDILTYLPEESPIVAGMFAYSASSAFADIAATRDTLGFELHAQALAEIIVKPDTIPPLVVGVYGPWGSGKSTFMTLVRNHLEAWDRRQHPEPTRWRRLGQRLFGAPETNGQPRIVCVEYNAWAYTDSDKLWAGLVEKISPYLDEQIPLIQKPFFWIRRNFLRFVGAALLGLLPVLAGLGFVIAQSFQDWPPLVHLLSSLTALLAGLTGSLKVVDLQQPLTQAVSALLKQYKNDDVEGVMSDIQTEFKQTVEDHFLLADQPATAPTAAQPNVKKMRQNKLKMVVMIDELDRCPLEKIVDILEGIKIFLAEEIFIVLMAVDTRVIAESVRLHYKDVKNPNLAREYMEKIIQIPIQVPEAGPRQLVTFVDSLMSVVESDRETAAATTGQQNSATTTPTPPPVTRAPLAVSENLLNPLQLADSATERAAITDFAAAYLDSNPRRIKRLLNTYRYVKIMAARRGERIDRADWQEKMINWLGFSMRWPSFMGSLVRQEPPPASVAAYRAFRPKLPSGQQPPDKAFDLRLPLGAEISRFELLADNFIVESPPEVVTPPPARQNHPA
jgi:hypothetical protein